MCGVEHKHESLTTLIFFVPLSIFLLCEKVYPRLGFTLSLLSPGLGFRLGPVMCICVDGTPLSPLHSPNLTGYLQGNVGPPSTVDWRLLSPAGGLGVRFTSWSWMQGLWNKEWRKILLRNTRSHQGCDNDVVFNSFYFYSFIFVF